MTSKPPIDMNLQLEDKRALVTGSSSGLGEAIAKALAAEGAAVVVHGRDRERARRVAAVLDGSYPWEVPAWVYLHRGQPVPAHRRLPGALGPIAVLLDDGTALYSRPEQGPLADPAYVLPGGVRVLATDLLAIRENLAPGLPVYFH